jgi:PAS domain S-box-containing protein
MMAANIIAMRCAPWAIPILTVGIYLFDLFTPLGLAVSILYVLPLLLTFLSSRERAPLYFTAIATGLIWVNLFLKPPGSPISYAVFNRTLGMIVLWGIAVGLIYYRAIEHKLVLGEADRDKTAQALVSERAERAHAEALMLAAQEARSYAEVAVLGATAGRRETEERLSDAQHRLEGIIQSAMDAIITVDEQQQIILFNRAAEQMFGCTAGEALGQPIDRFIPGRFRDAHRDHIAQFGRSHVTTRKMGELGAITGLRASAEEFPIEAAISQVAVGGKPYYTVILRDITERKQAEEALVLATERLQLAARAAEIGVWDWDIQKNELVWDGQMFTLYGVKKEDFGGAYEAWLSGVHPADRARCDEAIQQALKNEKPYDIEFQVRWPDGSVHDIKADGIVIWDAQRRPLRMTGTNYDITLRKRAEEQFRLTVEASPNGLLMVDGSGVILLLNRQIEQLFGYGRNELIGQSVDLLVPQRLRSSHAGDRAEFFAHSSSRAMGKGRDLFGVRKGGTEFPVEIGLNPIQTQDGMRVLASVVDITERKRIQEQLKKAERLAELGTLASGMAHEIGTPMNVIQGRAEYLLDRTKDETLRKGLKTIVSQVERITRVMNQLLAFARRKPVDRQVFDVRKVVEENLELFQERLAQHHIRLEATFAAPCPPVSADRDQMCQVVINLVTNAVHAMPDGGLLRVSLSPEKDWVTLTIGDSGHGIPEDVIKNIFEPFFTTKEFGKGTGLGLTVVKGIIEEHQGSIAVESEPGKGTMFTIRLPAYKPG